MSPKRTGGPERELLLRQIEQLDEAERKLELQREDAVNQIRIVRTERSRLKLELQKALRAEAGR
jgi:hypothetical protein